MIDIDTFLTTLYVMVDDFCKSRPCVHSRPGPSASLSCSEVVTLMLFAQWNRFTGQRDFYRYAERHLRAAFPTLPHRSQFNRLARQHHDDYVAFALHLVQQLHAQQCLYEILDTTAVPTRGIQRRGRGWLPGYADIGWSRRLGWFEGFRLLLAINPVGVITGFGFAPASAKDQPLADTLITLRHEPSPRLRSVGAPAVAPYIADQGFAAERRQKRWRQDYGVQFICPPQVNSPASWPEALKRWLGHFRQVIETVCGRLLDIFRLERDRPHTLSGFQANLAAKIGLHNFCMWLNQQLGRPGLAFANLVNW